MQQFNSKGAISKLLLILAVVLIIIIVGIFSYLRAFKSDGTEKKTEEQSLEEQKPPEPVYEVQAGEIRFILKSSRDLGPVVASRLSYQPPLTTTERFIWVTVGAQNKGKVDTQGYTWDLGNIVDSEGRIFIPSGQAYYFLPQPDQCGAVLKPEFDPKPCTKIYEVAKISEGLKVEVKNSGDKKLKEKFYLDLNL